MACGCGKNNIAQNKHTDLELVIQRARNIAELREEDALEASAMWCYYNNYQSNE